MTPELMEEGSKALARAYAMPTNAGESGGRDAAYGRVVAVMVLLQKLGASKVGFVTDPSTQSTMQSHSDKQCSPQARIMMDLEVLG